MDLWDRLAGGLQEYVENYCLYKSQSKVEPSYDVDYEIDCLDELQKHTTVNDYWVHQISGCKHINDLPTYLQKLVIQYLPRFFEKYPMYKGAECLQKKAKKHISRYYDGHYEESDLMLEEIEKQLEEEKKKVEHMTEWEDF